MQKFITFVAAMIIGYISFKSLVKDLPKHKSPSAVLVEQLELVAVSFCECPEKNHICQSKHMEELLGFKQKFSDLNQQGKSLSNAEQEKVNLIIDKVRACHQKKHGS